MSIWSNVTAHRALKATGKQRIAEYRKEWIEELRRDIATFLAAHSQLLTSGAHQKRYAEIASWIPDDGRKDKFLHELITLQSDKKRYAETLYTSYETILLKINQDEVSSKSLIDEMDVVLAKMYEPVSHAKVIAAAKSILKPEWDRVVIETKSERNN